MTKFFLIFKILNKFFFLLNQDLDLWEGTGRTNAIGFALNSLTWYFTFCIHLMSEEFLDVVYLSFFWGGSS